MAFVDRERGRTGAIYKTLASYDLHKVRKRCGLDGSGGALITWHAIDTRPLDLQFLGYLGRAEQRFS